MHYPIVLVSLLPLSAAFLFDLAGLGAPRGQCCCPPPPPPMPCRGYEPPPPAYLPPQPTYMPPPPPPPQPSYMQPPAYGTGIRRKRATKSGELEASSTDLLCNSPDVKRILRKGMSDEVSASRQKVRELLVAELGHELVVVCSEHAFEFTAPHDAEFCSLATEKVTCAAFAL